MACDLHVTLEGIRYGSLENKVGCVIWSITQPRQRPEKAVQPAKGNLGDLRCDTEMLGDASL